MVHLSLKRMGPLSATMAKEFMKDRTEKLLKPLKRQKLLKPVSHNATIGSIL